MHFCKCSKLATHCKEAVRSTLLLTDTGAREFGCTVSVEEVSAKLLLDLKSLDMGLFGG
uniref:Uncharacterized protein n=1 Tax=Rhizophora mucronata TaxID=61149 RepID=A0A2P2PDS2_RHIMU